MQFLWKWGKLKSATWGSSQMLVRSPGWLRWKPHAHVKQSRGPAVPYLYGIAGCFNISVPWIFQLGLDFAAELAALPLAFQRSYQTCQLSEERWEQSPAMEQRLNMVSLRGAERRGDLGVCLLLGSEDSWTSGCRQWIPSLFSVSRPSLLIALNYLQAAWELPSQLRKSLLLGL